MNRSTIREYQKEVNSLFHRIEREHPDWLDRLGATDDLEAFQWELTMIGYNQEIKRLREEKSQ